MKETELLKAEAPEILENIYGEIVKVYQNSDGTATAILEDTAIRKFKNYQTALEKLTAAGWRF